MNNKTIQIQQENVLNAYKNADKKQKELLEALFGSETFKPTDIRERVKTFEDACSVLGADHVLIRTYNSVCAIDDKVLNAFAKLQIIVAALNEGWKPKFEPGEYRWAPYFLLYTKDEIARMDDETKTRVVRRSYDSSDTSGGVACVGAGGGSSSSVSYVGSRLAFKSEELAEYAGKQFVEIYADFMLEGWRA